MAKKVMLSSLKVDPKLHRRIKVAAAKRGERIIDWVDRAVRAALARERGRHG